MGAVGVVVGIYLFFDALEETGYQPILGFPECTVNKPKRRASYVLMDVGAGLAVAVGMPMAIVGRLASATSRHGARHLWQEKAS